MAHTETHIGRAPTETQVGGTKLNIVATAIAAFRKRRQALAARRVLAELTPEQLNDMGLPQANHPALDIKAALITNLMSMR
ncbi:DUF1127 domain-containing protein [Phyllobacterium pellucidum]|uniref:DUF1127 domain-containing protein n=1 Tax=Phyllobacterium pellucidum TaxID=2740464 RepID=UPI001D154724|nr:DUF1127 domain-containing protein [Phyllobacterium sp. T1018]UGY10784.1 DUF1127 domain-containing protein [Phyllobacterium sp. T1018]